MTPALTPLGGDSPAQAPTRVIGLGASAGGLAPLTEFLAAFPAGQGCALLVVQHLSPNQPSVLAKLLQARTALTVTDAVHGQPLQADHVYVIVPGTRLRVSATAVEVETLSLPESLPASHVDALFESIAQAWGANAAGVMLSGMGSDGQTGLRCVLAQGGLGAAQAPESAQFGSMPMSAIALDAAVLVDLPSQLPERLLAAWGLRPLSLPALPAAPHPLAAPATTDPALAPTEEDAAHLHSIMACLAAGSGHDFSLYKPSTLHRRVARRMAVHGLDALAEYVALLRGSQQETDLLFRELLIGVTSFFRDPAVWAALAQTVLPALIERVQARSEKLLRVWVVGCSTGEEAYSLAMLLQEALAAAPGCRDANGRLEWRLQIFATDLSDDAIALARRGLFAESHMQGLSDERRARYFEAEGSHWRVKPSLRNTVLFARHDVTSDPPFSRLDLVSCRNLLIYFTSPLQRRVLPLFHYVLRPGGVLLLGNSETVGRFETGFAPLDEKLRLYVRSPQPLLGQGSVFPTKPIASKPLSTPAPSATQLKATVPELDPDLSATTPPQSALASAAERLMLEELAPPAVLTNEAGDILYLSGHTARYLEPTAGKANWNLHAMAQPGLRGPLLSGYQQLAATGLPPPAARLAFEQGGKARSVDMSLRGVRLAGHGPMVLVVFRDAANGPDAVTPHHMDGGDREAELNIALHAIQALREEMRTSQEELQSSNEELQSTNEELQSANEELTTSKEEMQAMNEELQSVNSEMQAKLDDLALAQSDLKNLLNSTQIATLFLDANLNVRRFTEQAKKVINLRETDVGRPLSDLTMVLDYPDLQNDITTVLRTLVFSEREIHTSDGHWFVVRIMPYRTLANVIDGAVLTFVDVSAAKDLEAQLRRIAG